MDARSWPALSIRGIISSNNISCITLFTHKFYLTERKVFCERNLTHKVWVVWVSRQADPSQELAGSRPRLGEMMHNEPVLSQSEGKYISVLSNSCKSDNGVARLKGSVHNTRGGQPSSQSETSSRSFWPMGARIRGPTWSAASLPGVVQDPNADVTTSLYLKMNSNFNNFCWFQR